MATPLCGVMHPDRIKVDGKLVTCHLDDGHGGLHHRWDHENHVAPGEEFGDGAITWHTEFAKVVTAGKRLTPTTIYRPHVVNGFQITHVVEPHPTHVMLHSNMPAKPVR